MRHTFHPEMNRVEVARPDRKISALLVGDVSVTGMTTTELSKYRADQTSHRWRDPKMIVDLLRSGEKIIKKIIYVWGDIGRPGAVPYRDGLSPLQAILAAGGFQHAAWLDSVILVRAQGRKNDLIGRKINLEEVVVDGAKEQITVAPYDVVFVPRTAAAKANMWVRQHVTERIPFAHTRFPGY